QQSMTVLVRLHLVTGADPTPQFGLSLLVRIKITRAERLAHFLNMPRQSFDEDFRHGTVRIQISSRLRRQFLDQGAHPDDVLLTWPVVHRAALLYPAISSMRLAKVKSNALIPPTSWVLRSIVTRLYTLDQSG